jgi:hypothetical protein
MFWMPAVRYFWIEALSRPRPLYAQPLAAGGHDQLTTETTEFRDIPFG